MANSGSITTRPGISTGGITATFYWSLSNIDADKGTATLNWSYKVTGGAKVGSYYYTWIAAYGDGNKNYLKINDSTKWYNNSQYKDGYRLVWGAHFVDSYVHQDHNGVYEATGYSSYSWVYMYIFLADGSQTIYYDDDGNTSFTVAASICGVSNNDVSSFSETVYPDKIERYSKSKKTSNSGASWGNVNFWKTTDGGRTWKKCNGYKTTNSGSSWSKIK